MFSPGCFPHYDSRREEATCDCGAVSPHVGWEMVNGPGEGPSPGQGDPQLLWSCPHMPGSAWALRKGSRGQEPTFWQPWVELVILIKSLDPKGLMMEFLIKSISSRLGDRGLHMITMKLIIMFRN